MKKTLLLFLVLISFTKTEAQLFAVSTKFITPNDALLSLNLMYPYNFDNAYEGFLYGADYSVSVAGSHKTFRGLKLTPIAYQYRFFKSKEPFFYVFIGADAGYLFNSGAGKNGIVLSPYLKLLKSKNKIYSIKSGYEYNTADGKQQFYLQANLDFGTWFLRELSKGY